MNKTAQILISFEGKPMKKLLLNLILGLVLMPFEGFSQQEVTFNSDPNTDCTAVYNGTFRDVDETADDAYFEINGASFTEYVGDYYIKAHIEWIDKCTYRLTFQESNMEDVMKTLTRGDEMVVAILKYDNGYYYKVNFQGSITYGKFIEIGKN